MHGFWSMDRYFEFGNRIVEILLLMPFVVASNQECAEMDAQHIGIGPSSEFYKRITDSANRFVQSIFLIRSLQEMAQSDEQHCWRDRSRLLIEGRFNHIKRPRDVS